MLRRIFQLKLHHVVPHSTFGSSAPSSLLPLTSVHRLSNSYINFESKIFGNYTRVQMHQTSISSFFKPKTNGKDKKEEEGDKKASPRGEKLLSKVEKSLTTAGSSKTAKSKAKAKTKLPTKEIGGTKRKSRASDEDEERGTSTTSPSDRNGNVEKKPRRRIMVPSSSSESENEDANEEAHSSPSPDSKSSSPSPSYSPIQLKKTSSSKSKSPSSSPEKEKRKSASPAPAPAKKTKTAKATVKAVVAKPTSAKMKILTTPKESSKSKSKPKSPPKEEAVESDGDKSEEDEQEEESVEDEKKPTPVTPKAAAKPVTASVPGWNNDYNPMKPKYHPVDDATWKKGERVPYLALANTLKAIEETSSRLKFMEILANYFRSVIALSPDDLLFSVYLCLNKLAPAYEGVELGIAETNIMKAIAQATGRSLASIKTDAAAQGDLGLVAESSRSNQKTLFQPKPLTVLAVFNKLKEIASMTGNTSQQKKLSAITSMLVSCKYSEARYLTRSLAGKLRIGLAEQSLLQALAHACFLTPPNQKDEPFILNAGKKLSPDGLKAKIDEETFKLKSCYCECPNYDILVNALLTDGTSGLTKHCKLTPGIPPRPMLAQPTKGVADVLQRFDGIKFTCEYKYDGERAQIHLLDGGEIRIYSRNQEDNTSKYPDIISRFKACVKSDVKSCILDTEAVAWDCEKQTILPFQVLSTRKRKDANESEIKVQVQLFAFDLLYLNGESLIKKPLQERRALLQENFNTVVGEFGFATSLDTDSMEEVQEFLEESIKGNCEGLMVKTLDVNASYELAKRSQKWLKLKKDYLDSGGDSLDLVVIGGFLGKGKRTGAYGGFLLACYDPDNEEFQTICKIGTGFTDENLQTHAESLKPHVIKGPKSYYRFHQNLTPDHWFDAVQVWEVKCADLSLSPVHLAAAGIADPERGISLRFPRFLRIRDDKNVEDATSSSQVADMYKNQEQVKNSTTTNTKGDDDDFY